MRAIELDGAHNVRELGGLVTRDDGWTRHCVLYRGDSLDAISERDEDLLFNKLHIGAVIDVRSDQEITYAKWKDSAVRYHRLSLLGDQAIGRQAFPNAAPEKLAKVYLSNLQQGISAVCATFEVLASHLSAGVPCIIHCAAGRDRTGAIIATLLAALDVCDEDIARDYVQSNVHAHHVTQRLAENPLYANGRAEDGKPVMASAETILRFLALLRGTYETPAHFLIGSGLAATALAQLQKALVEYPPGSSHRERAVKLAEEDTISYSPKS
jgi:protein-tyrosine phosphatase